MSVYFFIHSFNYFAYLRFISSFIHSAYFLINFSISLFLSSFIQLSSFTLSACFFIHSFSSIFHSLIQLLSLFIDSASFFTHSFNFCLYSFIQLLSSFIHSAPFFVHSYIYLAPFLIHSFIPAAPFFFDSFSSLLNSFVQFLSSSIHLFSSFIHLFSGTCCLDRAAVNTHESRFPVPFLQTLPYLVTSLKGHACGSFIERLSFTLSEQDAGLEHDAACTWLCLRDDR